METGSAKLAIQQNLSKMVFECIGTFVLTMIIGGIIADGNVVAYNSDSEHYTCSSVPQAPILFGLWVLIIFGFKISGSHYNPAITIAFMFRKDVGTFNRPTGLLYIMSQVGGAILAGIILALTLGG
jgi:glycerol uptake facilitator-like aquaporin